MARTKYNILFIDQAEYYILCDKCYYHHKHKQWSGSTNPFSNKEWEERVKAIYQEAAQKKHCEFCGQRINTRANNDQY